jgi:PAS domain S-box-containing protein
MSNRKKEFNILVIEDNRGDFALVEEFLQEQTDVFNLFHAWTFKESAEVLKGCSPKFDIILLDLSLPDKTGLSLIREIVELSLNIPVIVLTGYADVAFGVASLSLGISDYILKADLTPTSLYKSIIYSSERKKTTLALEESEKKYSELFHLSPLPMFVFETRSLNFLDVNDACLNQYGYSREEFLCLNLSEIQPAEDTSEFEKRLTDNLQNPEKDSLGIYKHLKKNGEIIHVDIQSNFIEYKGINAKLTIATDVTERINYINEIEQQNEKLREISWIQSHVVRAPLARLMGLVSLLKDGRNDGEEKQKMLEYILISSRELDDVIGEITDITKIAGDDKYCKNGLLLQYATKD